MITVSDTKNNETRYIPMNDIVREALQRHPKRIMAEKDKEGKVIQRKACPLVFSRDDGEPLKSIQTAHQNSMARAKTGKHIRFHDLRHTFASHLVMKGIDLRTVAKLMGHKDIKMTMRYAHLAPDHLQAAVDVLTQRSDTVPREQKAG